MPCRRALVPEALSPGTVSLPLGRLSGFVFLLNSPGLGKSRRSRHEGFYLSRMCRLVRSLLSESVAGSYFKPSQGAGGCVGALAIHGAELLSGWVSLPFALGVAGILRGYLKAFHRWCEGLDLIPRKASLGVIADSSFPCSTRAGLCPRYVVIVRLLPQFLRALRMARGFLPPLGWQCCCIHFSGTTTPAEACAHLESPQGSSGFV